MSKQIFRLVHDTARHGAVQAVKSAPDGYVVEIKPATRTLDQNALLWPLLEDLSAQINWYGTRLTKEEWKDVMTAGLKRSKVVPGIDGGFVVVGASTSKMDKKTFSDLVELIYSFGAGKGVKFNEQIKG